MISLLGELFGNFLKNYFIENEYAKENGKVAISSIGLRYPSLRDHPLHTADMWLKGKRIDDGAEGFWRIHDSLYDLEIFTNIHPGGKDWIELTKGTDITEAFESHHISMIPESMLTKYFVRKAKHPRNYPFTFHEHGFYRTLKRNVKEELRNIPKISRNRSKYLTDLLFANYIIFAIMAVIFRSLILGFISGLCLSLTSIAAHNFFHQRDNFRMYYFDFTMMPSRSWRVGHALSHHLYTNTVYDLEISSLEPFLQYLPTKKNYLFKYVSWIYSPIIWSFLFFTYFIRTIVQIVVDSGKFSWTLLLPLIVPSLMYIVSGQPIMLCALMYIFIIFIASLHFGFVGLNAGHHHPDIFHDGDASRPTEELDWGVHQLDAVMDRNDITGSHFLVLTHFGDHALHHLFPTIDHGLLEYLYPVFIKTCQQFGVQWKIESQLEAVKGQYRQLAKEEPKKIAPKRLKQTVGN